MRVYNFDTEDNEMKFLRNLDYKYQLIFRIGITTGLRISDIVRLKKKILSIKEPTIKEKKTGKSKRIYIPSKLRTELIEYSETNKEYIFETKAKSGHITRQAVWKHYKKIAKRLNIKINIGTHTTRKNYTTKMLKKGKSYTYMKNKLNHDNLADTLLYLVPSPERETQK